MTAPANLAGFEPGLIGPGRLVLVVGPSGAGKDTLMRLAAEACRDAVFPRRVVTRASSQAESNEEMAREVFDASVAVGEFAFHWHAHGLSYGLRRSLDDAIRAGRTVVVNVSRTVIADARARYATPVVVLVTAPADVLEERLAGRSRASDGSLEARLARATLDADVTPDITIVNVGSAETNAAALIAAIRG